MTNRSSVKRKYDSSRRQAQARETRRQIAESARELFIERGYAGTTLDAIARSASVASETVYAIFGSKRKILWYLIDTAIGGDEQPIHIIDRAEPQAVLHDTDPSRQIRMFAQGIAQVLERAAPIIEVMRSAAKIDREIAGLLARMLKERMENMSLFAQNIAKNGGLREGMDVSTASELIWTLTSPEVFLLLTRERKYSTEQFAAWLQTNLSRLLLP